MQGAWRSGRKRALAINRTTDAVNDSANECFADVDTCSATSRGDRATGMDILHLPKGHEQNAMVAKSHHLGLQSR